MIYFALSCWMKNLCIPLVGVIIGPLFVICVWWLLFTLGASQCLTSLVFLDFFGFLCDFGEDRSGRINDKSIIQDPNNHCPQRSIFSKGCIFVEAFKPFNKFRLRPHFEMNVLYAYLNPNRSSSQLLTIWTRSL